MGRREGRFEIREDLKEGVDFDIADRTAAEVGVLSLRRYCSPPKAV